VTAALSDDMGSGHVADDVEAAEKTGLVVDAVADVVDIGGDDAMHVGGGDGSVSVGGPSVQVHTNTDLQLSAPGDDVQCLDKNTVVSAAGSSSADDELASAGNRLQLDEVGEPLDCQTSDSMSTRLAGIVEGTVAVDFNVVVPHSDSDANVAPACSVDPLLLSIMSSVEESLLVSESTSCPAEQPANVGRPAPIGCELEHSVVDVGGGRNSASDADLDCSAAAAEVASNTDVTSCNVSDVAVADTKSSKPADTELHQQIVRQLEVCHAQQITARVVVSNKSYYCVVIFYYKFIREALM